MEKRKEELQALQESVELIEKAWNRLDFTRWYLDVSGPISEYVRMLGLQRDVLNEQVSKINADVKIETKEQVDEEVKKGSNVVPFTLVK